MKEIRVLSEARYPYVLNRNIYDETILYQVCTQNVQSKQQLMEEIGFLTEAALSHSFSRNRCHLTIL